MKVLIDECLPRPLKSRLVGHDYRTVQEMGWDGVKNGQLLLLAEKDFEVFLTVTKISATSKTSPPGRSP